jgi:hypothetical protein
VLRNALLVAGIVGAFLVGLNQGDLADATGIPLDAHMQALSQEVRDALHLERFTVYKEAEYPQE